MKSSSILKYALGGVLTVFALWLCGCGGSNANQVTVTLTDSLGRIVTVTQADTITATVNGPATVNGVSNLDVTFLPCTYTTTSTSGTTSKAATCPADGSFGTFSNVTTTTEIYTAPAQIPDPTTYPNLVIIITAQSVADKSKSGTISLLLNSGIAVTVTPASATLALGEHKLFTAALTTDTNASDVSWGITNSTVNTGGTPSIAGTYTLTTPQCSPTCGSITDNKDGTVTFMAPATLPTNTTVTIYAIATKDPSRHGLATITLVTGGTPVFSSLWPASVPQGAIFDDIFLNATFLTSQITVTLTGPNGSVPIDTGTDALKVFFTPSTYSATTGPVSTGARLRLTADQLPKPGTYSVNIKSGTGADAGTHSFQVVPARPALVAAYPSDISEGTPNQTFTVDGGYYGTSANPTSTLTFNGSTLVASSLAQTPRRIQATNVSSGSTAGLLPISVTNAAVAGSSQTVYSNISVLPNYANQSDLAGKNLPYDTAGHTFIPCVAAAGLTCTTDNNGNTYFQLCPTGNAACMNDSPTPLALGAGTFPSAIAIDPILNLAAITEAGTDTVQYVNLGTSSTSPTLLGAAHPTGKSGAAVGTSTPTGVAIDRNVCTSATGGVCSVTQAIAAVVNYQAQSLAILTVPGGSLLETIDLSQLIPPSGTTVANPSPNPYSVGIDPFTHRALVAFASTNAGYVVNLDQTQSPSICLQGLAPSDGSSYCPVALATLFTGPTPQVAFEAGAHLAYVTPGGAGSLTAVNLSTPSQGPLAISSAQRTAGVVTVTMAANTPHNILPGSNPTVLISGLPTGTNKTSFNGAFPVSQVTSNLTFTYVQAGEDDTTASTSTNQGKLNYGTNALQYLLDPFVQGIDINPITHSAVLSDYNLGGGQITYINSLDQAVTTQSLCKNLTLTLNGTCVGEIHTAAVAYQPFTNTVVSLNSDASLNQISLLDPAAGQRIAIIPTGQTAAATYTSPNKAVTVNLVGAVAVDPILNLAIVVNAGSGNISPLYLGHIKPLQIQEVSTTNAVSNGVNVGITAQSVLVGAPSAQSSVSGIKIFGTGFTSSSAVRFDGMALPSGVTFVSANELDVTIPMPTLVSMNPNVYSGVLSAPHNFGLDVANTDGTSSNIMDFRVIRAIALPACAGGGNPAPGGVAIADQVPLPTMTAGVFTYVNYAVVTNTACNTASVISLDQDASFGSLVYPAAPTGKTPTGVATIPRFGYAVISNNGDSTATILDLTTGLRAVGGVTGTGPDVSVGTNPSGVAIEQETGLAVIANNGNNTASVIDLTPLKASPQGTLAPLTTATDQNPIAVAVDPDNGANATGIAVITSIGITTGYGALDAIDLSISPPTKSNAGTLSQLAAIPTGIVFDPAATPNTLFYATESDYNAIGAYNPGLTPNIIQVGINPYSIAYNYQTGSILTVNAASNTVSVLDSQTLETKATIGIGGVSLFSAAIEPLSNLAVIADQVNNRVLLFPMPH